MIIYRRFNRKYIPPYDDKPPKPPIPPGWHGICCGIIWGICGGHATRQKA